MPTPIKPVTEVQLTPGVLREVDKDDDGQASPAELREAFATGSIRRSHGRFVTAAEPAAFTPDSLGLHGVDWKQGISPARPAARNELVYTPESRAFEHFAAGPSPGAGPGVTYGTLGAGLHSPLGSDDAWQVAGEVLDDSRLPTLRGTVMAGAWKTFDQAGLRLGAGGGLVPGGDGQFAFVTAEAAHPNLLRMRDLGGSGVDLGLNSYARAELFLPGDGAQAIVGRTSLKWFPDVTAERNLSLWGGGPDSRAFLSLGGDLDAAAPGVSSYVAGGLETRPLPWLGLGVQGYVPLATYSNDLAAEPLARLAVRVPYLVAGTTQGVGQDRYDISAGMRIGPVRLGGFAVAERDKVAGANSVTGGVELSLPR